MSDETVVLRSCPFCGNQEAVAVAPTTNGMMMVHCDNCGASGYETDDREIAIEFWNRRAPVGASVPAEIAQTIRDALAVWNINAAMDVACGDASEDDGKECDHRYRAAITWLAQHE